MRLYLIKDQEKEVTIACHCGQQIHYKEVDKQKQAWLLEILEKAQEYHKGDCYFYKPEFMLRKCSNV